MNQQCISLDSKSFYIHGHGVVTIPVGVNRNHHNTAWVINYRENGVSHSDYFADRDYGNNPWRSLRAAVKVSRHRRRALLTRRIFNQVERKDKIERYGQSGVMLSYSRKYDYYSFRVINPIPYEADGWLYIGTSSNYHSRFEKRLREAVQLRREMEDRYCDLYQYRM